MFQKGLTQRFCCARFERVIPAFESTGLLPPGVHWAPWLEIEQRFGTNAHRIKLLSGLHRAVLSLQAAKCSVVYLDGSFVTAKSIPTDYDACWESFGVTFNALDPVFLDFSNRRAAQKAKYFGEFFPAVERAETVSPFRIYLNFFQIDKDTGAAKGIVGLKI